VNIPTPLERVRDLLGTQKAIADLFGLSAPTVHEWFRRGSPPADRCIALEEATGGKVTRYELRPDVFGVPGQARKAG